MTGTLGHAQTETPSLLQGGKVISAVEAKGLVDKKSALFVDTRSAVNFGKGHIPGAKAIPYKGGSENSADADLSKDQSVVFYSDGPTGWKSYKAAVMAVKAGHKNVHYLRGGWSEWSSKGLPVE